MSLDLPNSRSLSRCTHSRKRPLHFHRLMVPPSLILPKHSTDDRHHCLSLRSALQASRPFDMPPIMPRIPVLTIPQSILTTTSMSIRQLDLIRTPYRLTSLPPEIVVCIFEWCCTLSRVKLAMTCKHLAKAAVVNRVLSFETGKN